MPNPYFQVARTYLQRPFCSLQRSLIISGVIIFFAFLFFNNDSGAKHEFLPVYLFPFIALSAYWAVHVKGQFADARASMTPGFRKVHTVVATVAAIVFVIILPGVTAPLIEWQSLGFISISTLLFGIILWFVLRPGTIFFLLMIGGFISIQQKPVYNVIDQIFSGKEPFQVFIILSIGVILSITGIIRLFLLNEEIPEYHLNFKKTKYGQAELSGLQWQRMEKSNFWQWWRRLVSGLAARMIYHARHSADSCWSRIHRWDYSGLSVWTALIYAAFLNLVFTLIDFFNNANSPPAIIITMATIMPILLANKLLKAKNSFFSRELMMPVRRDAYLKQTGMLFASRQFTGWWVIIALSVVWMFTRTAKPDPEFLIYSVSYSLMMQIWFFGLTVWLSSFRSSIMSFMIGIIAVIFAGINITALEGKIMIQWRHLIMPFGCLLEILGLLLAWWGYRRWLARDFD